MDLTGRRANHRSLFKPRTRKEDDDELTESVVISARKSGQLNLSAKGLSSVPSKVWVINELTCEELKTLDVTLGFDEGKERWWEQEQLTTLNLSSNSLTKLDPQVQLLSELNFLDLHDNVIQYIPREIGNLNKLRHLNLAVNRIHTLPLDMYKLCELRFLDLGNNLLKNIDAAIGDLIMLEHLNLSCNNLTTLPVGMGYLVRLTSLELSHNMLKELPPDITSMRALKKLDASFNQIEDVPPMGELRRMEVLVLHTNNLSTSPDTNGCTALRELHLGNNKISAINVSSLESMSHLKTLTLGNNKIRIIPDEIIQLCNLERLDLSNNNIVNIPFCISLMPNLHTFLIDGNNVRNVRRDVIQCGTSRLLRYLRESVNVEDLQNGVTSSLVSNDTGLFPDKYALRIGKLLSIANQNLCEIPDTTAQDASEAEVTCIDLSKNQFRELPAKLSVVTSVRELKLARNRLLSLPEWIGEKYQHMQFLDVSNNQLTTLPGTLSTLNYLKEINMSYNRFVEIPECIYDLPGLEILTVNNNQIEKIDATLLSKLPRLANLDLSNNNIGYVPPELGNLKKLTYLALCGNCFKQPRHATLTKSTEEVLAYLRDRISS
ncbi:leucine-rich repeat-containing protein 40-like [Athalia rosae]|uniref:leucine-rich repeat-containing protein 40-like n=1 Tax=Athalia rosae TaxID=37344 RepID=UPI002034532E|nr:leucine-rich repeat-containing protein 40-like [Athalia rosae]XP_048507108.1 leucine-rich repeat-containing protein 40-like [Athalia rosae]